MSERLEAKVTPVDRTDVFVALWRAWLQLFDGVPSRKSICLLVAHWAFETGWGKSMWCFNFGNAKAKADGPYDYTYFPCGEDLSVATANRLVAAMPDKAKIVRVDGDKIEVKFWPDHPACCFRAFETIEEGAIDYLGLLRSRFSKAWPMLMHGDPVGFVHALKAQGYFTAAEGPYSAAMTSIFDGLLKTMPTTDLPALSDDQAEKLKNLVALTLDEIAREEGV